MDVVQTATGAVAGHPADVSGADNAAASRRSAPTGTEAEERPVREFLGIPYAAAPVGELRWRPPRPRAPWTGQLACDAFGPACPQPPAAYQDHGVLPGEMGDDCLPLNIWTPARTPADKLPVMLWIHGGAFVIGSSRLPMYHGARLARRGVVVVTVNYRLGPLGFFASPQLAEEAAAESGGRSGNYGLLDQIAALRWVRENIEGFGGDPRRVTVFGESAGAFSICRLMVSPPARGLFRAVITQSGGPCGDWLLRRDTVSSLERTYRQWEHTAELLGLEGRADRLPALREVPSQRLIEVTRPGLGLLGGMQFGPVVDGSVLPDEPITLWADGRQARIPLLTGTNTDEATAFTSDLERLRPWEYRALLYELFGPRRKEVERLFPVERPDGDVSTPPALAALRELVTVMLFESPARFAAAATAAAGRAAYLYRFAHTRPTDYGRALGCYHGAEIPYVIGNLPAADGYGPADRALSDSLQRCWVAFAESGDPNADGLPDWPLRGAGVTSPAPDLQLVFGDDNEVAPDVEAAPGIEAAPDPHTPECELMERLWREPRPSLPSDPLVRAAVGAASRLRSHRSG